MGSLFQPGSRDEEAQLGNSRDGLLQQLETLVKKINSLIYCYPCDVATRSRHARNKAYANWIGHHADDRYCRGRFFEHEKQTGARHEDHARLDLDGLPDQPIETFGVSLT